MTLLRYALERFRRLYVEHKLEPSGIVDFVVQTLVLDGGDEHELINWYETRATELRSQSGIRGKPLPDDCTCTVDPVCSVHGEPVSHATKHE